MRLSNSMKLPAQPFTPKAVASVGASGERAQVAGLFDKGTFATIRKDIGALPPGQKTSSYSITPQDAASMQESEKYCNSVDREKINTSLKKFADDLGAIHKEFDAKDGADQIRYADKLQGHVKAVLENPGTVSHDLDIVFRESLRFLSAKAVRHEDDGAHEKIGEKIIEKLYENFPGYIAKSHTYRDIFEGANDLAAQPGPRSSEVNSTLAQKTYAKLVQRLGDKDTQASDSVRAGALYKEAAIQLIKAEKPKYRVDGQYVAYMPTPDRRDMHAHIIQNYDPKKSYPGGLPWAVNMGAQTGVVGSSIMPIPHHIVMKDPPSNAPADYKYYTDADVERTVFASFDHSMIKAFNGLNHEQQQTLVLAATGVEMMTDPAAMARLDKAAEAFSHNVTKAKLEAGEKNILVLFGELTTNKPQVPQEMIGSKPGTFVDNSAKLQLALFSAAQKGALRALNTASPEILPEAERDKVNIQIRLVIHTDTERAGKKLNVEKISDNDASLRDIAQPTVGDLEQVCNQINEGLGKMERPANIRHVVQLAHFAGVNTVNWADREAGRTAKVNQLVDRTRTYQNLEVLMDTSWLTASARYINTGMGDFLKTSNDKSVQDLGDRFARADKIANDGFMFFSAGERHFQERLAAGDKSAEVIDGLALMRESCDRCTETYFRELGGIYADLQKNDALLGKIREHIETDSKRPGGPSEGNFVGMLLKQHNSDPGKQAKTPFVWGADGLTQFAEPSGANKFLMYANQLGPVETLMEQLGTDGIGRPVGDYRKILKSMKMGDEREQIYWGQAKTQANVGTEGIQPDGPLDQTMTLRPGAVDNVAAHHVLQSRHAVGLHLNNENSVLGGTNLMSKL